MNTYAKFAVALAASLTIASPAFADQMLFNSSDIGKTVTLELRPDQVATLSAARQGGTLTLALRSIVDANAVDGTPEEQAIKRPGGVNVIRYGVQARQLTSQK